MVSDGIAGGGCVSVLLWLVSGRLGCVAWVDVGGGIAFLNEGGWIVFQGG